MRHSNGFGNVSSCGTKLHDLFCISICYSAICICNSVSPTFSLSNDPALWIVDHRVLHFGSFFNAFLMRTIFVFSLVSDITGISVNSNKCTISTILNPANVIPSALLLSTDDDVSIIQSFLQFFLLHRIHLHLSL